MPVAWSTCTRPTAAPARRSRAPSSKVSASSPAPDLLFWHEGKSWALELKSDGGHLSEAQADMLDRLGKAGVTTAVAHGIDSAIAILENWGFLRGKAQTRLDDNADNLAEGALY